MLGTLLNGRFRLEEQIGSGGMSTVYRAFDEVLERSVAIKVMHASIAEDGIQLERFRREARTAAKMSHPHVVTVIDAGEDEGHPFIVLEYVEGETLKDRIRRCGSLPVPEAVAYAIEIGRALQAAHGERLVHRDVKPQNVLIDPEGRAKVTDFGITRSLDDAEGLTATGRVLGTTDYVSPEQALGEVVTEQSDVYSLGIVLFEMLVGRVPFRAESQVGVAMKHVREPMPDVQRLRPEISAALAAVVERATAKERRNRYATVTQMLDDLEQALAIEVARQRAPNRRGDLGDPRAAAQVRRDRPRALAQPEAVGRDAGAARGRGGARGGRHPDPGQGGQAPRGRSPRPGRPADQREADGCRGLRSRRRRPGAPRRGVPGDRQRPRDHLVHRELLAGRRLRRQVGRRPLRHRGALRGRDPARPADAHAGLRHDHLRRGHAGRRESASGARPSLA